MLPPGFARVRQPCNGGDAVRVASTFPEDSVTHASVGPEPLGASFVGRAEIERGVAAVAARCPAGRFQTLRVTILGDFGTFADIVTGPDGR